MKENREPFIHSRPLTFDSGNRLVDEALLKLIVVARELHEAKHQWLTVNGPPELNKSLHENYKEVQAAVCRAAETVVVYENAHHDVNLEGRKRHYWRALRHREQRLRHAREESAE